MTKINLFQLNLTKSKYLKKMCQKILGIKQGGTTLNLITKMDARKIMARLPAKNKLKNLIKIFNKDYNL